MNNKMHAWLCGIVISAMLAAGIWGSVHDVYAKEGTDRTYPTVSVEVVKASNLSETKTNTAGKIVPTIEITTASAPVTGGSSSSKGSAGSSLSGSVAGIAYSDLAMANVHEAVNVRKEASEESEIVGKLFKDCGGQILEKKEGWTKLKSGEVTGWVSNDYLLFGAEAKKLADSVVSKVATSTTSSLRLRMEPNENSKILDLLAEGDKIDVINEDDKWVEVEYSDGTQCYVSADYVTISYELGSGKTIEKIKAEEEAERKAQEASKPAETKSDGKKSTDAPAQTNATPAPVNTAPVPSTFDDVTLLAALIQCEAGNEIYEGQVAVGSAVINRLKTGRWGSSIYSVIYAKSQFGPAGTGMVAQVAAAGPKASCIKAAQDAISGVSYIGGATSFRNVRSGHLGIVIGNHVFW
ncbi:MAG: cell wall hydrolase [Lachnospiraceae bacterium]|nr:cell wall hydrolase [Lachnospiraceae bacterium]